MNIYKTIPDSLREFRKDYTFIWILSGGFIGAVVLITLAIIFQK